MRLCSIKLVGFKSFVDPTELIIPGNLVGIVGPNGCGKSNIIDAVTWVLGESSAKHLRGESLTDVIFSGSSARQPVSQASVELIFDNTEKKLGGQYASYNEISIKRQINKEAVSTYYLNGTRCRRRDITAIFLGTGLGSRNYAIIEQGMISRLIEAKPEELRIFIEEAAGISKYRERRRETETRIRHTRENIERLTDIREELEKQLNHLQRQAKSAQQYKNLKQEQRQLSVELSALNWRDLNTEMCALKEASGARENAVAATIAEIRTIEAAIEKLREALRNANQHFSDMQSDYYKIGSDISQYEQKLQHTHEKITAIEAELEKARQTHADTARQHEQDQAEYEKLQTELAAIEPKLQSAKDASDAAHNMLTESEEAMQVWQTDWDTFNESFSEFNKQEQIDKTRLEHLEYGLADLAAQRVQLEQAITKYEDSDLNHHIQKSAETLATEETKRATLLKQHAEKQNIVKEYRGKIRTLSNQIDIARQKFQHLKGRLTALETLQQSPLDDNQELSVWLQAHNLDKQPRLSQSIKAEPRWTHAVETVLGMHLHDICVDNISTYITPLEKAPGKIGLINASSLAAVSVDKQYPRLIDKITTHSPIPSILAHVYVADSSVEAHNMLAHLALGESVITDHGVWISHDWIIVNNANTTTDGVLSREAEITAIKQALAACDSEIKNIEMDLLADGKALEAVESALDEQQSLLNNQQQKIADVRTQLAAMQTESAQQSMRYQQYLEERDSNQVQSQSDKAEIAAITHRLEQIEKDKIQLQNQRYELSAVKEKHRKSLHNARMRWQQTQNESHAIALQFESFSARRAAYEQTIKRNDIQILQLATHITALEKDLSENKLPVAEMQEKLATFLKDKILAEKNLNNARANVQTIETNMRELEQNRHKHEQDLELLRSDLEKARLSVNSCQIKLEAVEAQLAAEKQTAKALLAEIETGANQAKWNDQLAVLDRKIQRLGPINLAAIDEYKQGAERKMYLESQNKDLVEALTTLENAIHKIDKETRIRFRETFDALNDNIKVIFPQLFGGGQAYLELMDDDLLQTGVAIMARPPGKKNSNIHLLSGGEKALTAIVLVFGIFKLNPAPFCILDEVDAPLDDTNVERFSELLKSMSDEIQFIFITHNKITMEIASHLSGVTMYESGVSRLVSVDMEEVLMMTATA